MGKLALANRDDIKTVVGIGLAKNSSPITIVRRFLEKLGFGIQLTRTQTVQKKRVRIYKITCPQDGREKVFQAWLHGDRQCPGSSEQWMAEYWQKLQSAPKVEEQNQPFVQLSLELG